MAQAAPIEERYAFVAEWADPASGLVRTFHLIYYIYDKTIEMYDLRTRQTFVKRCQVPDVRLDDLYLGSKVTIHSRQLLVKDYADSYTMSKLESTRERTLCIVKPDAVKHLGKIIRIIEQAGLQIGQLRMTKLNRAQAEEFYAVHKARPFFGELVRFMTSGPCVAIELLGANAIRTWRGLLGPTNTAAAREEAPASIRALYGTDNTANAAHGSDAPDTASAEIDFFFGAGHAKFETTARFHNCTLAIIKPGAVTQGKVGEIIDAITEGGFVVGAAELFSIERVNAEEFYQVYVGVVPEVADMAAQLMSGPCICLEILGDEDIVPAFRALCGPPDPEIARHLRPTTLRAIHGTNKIKNAVHCTDLPEDGLLEVEYFFKIMQD